MKHMHNAIVSSFWLVAMAITSHSAVAQSPPAPIPSLVPVTNFDHVTDFVWRSARPNPAGLKALKQQALATIIDLEDIPAIVDAESGTANADQIHFIPAPMHVAGPITDAQIDQIMETLKAAPTQGRVLVHCMHGQDRTGLVIGLYRVLVMGWTPKDAYTEMIAHQFHPKYKVLYNYFVQRTHYAP